MLAATSCNKYLSRVCRDKHTLVVTKDMFVMTKVSLSQEHLSQQNYVCRDKSFVVISILLLRQKTCFVETKILLVAAPANCICGYI